MILEEYISKEFYQKGKFNQLLSPQSLKNCLWDYFFDRKLEWYDIPGLMV